MDSRYERALSWLDRLTAMLGDFKEGEEDINWSSIQATPANYVKLSEGCFIRAVSKSDREVVIMCKMNQGAVLPIHRHSNFSEHFQILAGSMLDKVSANVITAPNEITFANNTWHQPEALNDSLIKITCKLINNADTKLELEG